MTQPPSVPPVQFWRTAPPDLMLRHGQVHVFRFALDLPEQRTTALWPALSGEEQTRAARFRQEAHRQRYIAAHGQMREVLGWVLNQPPERVEIVPNPYGKPALTAGEICFNLSHSDGLCLLAISRGQEVGIDIERLQPHLDWPNIARRFFAPAEIEALFALSDPQQALAFLLGWTRKEAYLKARGLGLTIPLDQFAVSLDPSQPAGLITADPGVHPGQVWSLYGLEPGEGYAAALAVEDQADAIFCWDWPGPGEEQRQRRA